MKLIRTLIPEEGKWLYNEKDNAITDKLDLGIFANVKDWVEITEEEKNEIEETKE